MQAFLGSAMLVLLGVLLHSAIGDPVLPPLSTRGNQIVDRNGNAVKLACVNWYGFDQLDFVIGGLWNQPASVIVNNIAGFGFNCIRMPWGLEMFQTNPIVGSYALVANPQYMNKTSMEIMDSIIELLAAAQIAVILDNHVSNNNWCCSTTDGNGLWYNDEYPASAWFSDWQGIVTRYKDEPYVIGCDLRNEIRQSTINGTTINPTWGSGDVLSDWHMAATECANNILEINPNLLIVVEGLSYDLDLTGIAQFPIVLNVPHRVVYEAHNYQWDQTTDSYEVFEAELDAAWGYILNSSDPDVVAPIWLGEFGTCNSPVTCYEDAGNNSQGWWFQNIVRYIGSHNLSYSYWDVDGTQSTANGRTFNAADGYGVFNPSWTGPTSFRMLEILQLVGKAFTQPWAQTCDYAQENYPAENSGVYLYCAENQTISRVLFASFGTPTGNCTAGLSLGNCTSSISNDVVEKACLGLPFCRVSADYTLFDNPCPDVTKTLAVVVECA